MKITRIAVLVLGLTLLGTAPLKKDADLDACKKRRKAMADAYFAAAHAAMDRCLEIAKEGGIHTECSYPGLKGGWEACDAN